MPNTKDKDNTRTGNTTKKDDHKPSSSTTNERDSAKGGATKSGHMGSTDRKGGKERSDKE